MQSNLKKAISFYKQAVNIFEELGNYYNIKLPPTKETLVFEHQNLTEAYESYVTTINSNKEALAYDGEYPLNKLAAAAKNYIQEILKLIKLQVVLSRDFKTEQNKNNKTSSLDFNSADAKIEKLVEDLNEFNDVQILPLALITQLKADLKYFSEVIKNVITILASKTTTSVTLNLRNINNYAKPSPSNSPLHSRFSVNYDSNLNQKEAKNKKLMRGK